MITIIITKYKKLTHTHISLASVLLIQVTVMKYTILEACLIVQLLLLQSTICNGHTIKDEILKEVKVMLGEMENKLISQFHVSTKYINFLQVCLICLMSPTTS